MLLFIGQLMKLNNGKQAWRIDIYFLMRSKMCCLDLVYNLGLNLEGVCDSNSFGIENGTTLLNRKLDLCLATGQTNESERVREEREERGRR